MFAVVVTDLDGTLLDHRTYTLEPALPAIEKLRTLRIPLVFCSSKTAAELRGLQEKLNMRTPFISENGGAIHIPKANSDQEEVIVLGLPYEELCKHLLQIEAKLGLKFRRFEDMSAKELAFETGLPEEEAELAKLREFDLPFAVEGNTTPADLQQEVRQRGLRLTRGARFFHLTGDNDKGKAVKRLVEFYEEQLGGKVQSIGLGDSENDLSLLRAVNIPIIIPNPESAAPVLLDSPALLKAPAPGPEGWNSAILSLLAVLDFEPHYL